MLWRMVIAFGREWHQNVSASSASLWLLSNELVF